MLGLLIELGMYNINASMLTLVIVRYTVNFYKKIYVLFKERFRFLFQSQEAAAAHIYQSKREAIFIPIKSWTAYDLLKFISL